MPATIRRTTWGVEGGSRGNLTSRLFRAVNMKAGTVEHAWWKQPAVAVRRLHPKTNTKEH